ncbi:MAG: FkbM family methyltransferase [Holophaga sp.]|nr:FkbM family methyltransferase [Holophaga sp.]
MTLSWNFLTNPLARLSRNHANSRLFWRLKEPLRKLFTPRRNSPIEDWIWLDRFDGDLKIQINRNAYLGSLLYWHGGHAQEESAYFKLFLKPGMVVVDAGANFGELTLIAAKQVGPTGHVYSFEPVPSIFQVLNRNIVANGFNHVHAQNTGLHEAPGNFRFTKQMAWMQQGKTTKVLELFSPLLFDPNRQAKCLWKP